MNMILALLAAVLVALSFPVDGPAGICLSVAGVGFGVAVIARKSGKS